MTDQEIRAAAVLAGATLYAAVAAKDWRSPGRSASDWAIQYAKEFEAYIRGTTVKQKEKVA